MSLPKVSVLTPTYNRREFFPQYLRYVNAQTYPKHLIEMVVVDDGDDPIEDMCVHDKRIRYVRLTDRKPVGEKRNIAAQHATGEILVNMDDDDYYPPKRIANAVTKIRSSKTPLAGSTTMYTYFVNTGEIKQLGPYHKRHATAGTMAYTKEYAMKNLFDGAASKAEESSFTMKFTEEMVQLDPMHAILCIAHYHNTVDKNTIKDSPACKDTKYKLKNFIKEARDREFYEKLKCRYGPTYVAPPPITFGSKVKTFPNMDASSSSPSAPPQTPVNTSPPDPTHTVDTESAQPPTTSPHTVDTEPAQPLATSPPTVDTEPAQPPTTTPQTLAQDMDVEESTPQP